MDGVRSDERLSLQKGNLDFVALEQKVMEWRNEYSLHSQKDFSPPGIIVSETFFLYHDRTHVLLHDYLETDSRCLQKVFDEDSLPSVYEELLVIFCAKLTHRPGEDPFLLTSEEEIEDSISIVNHLGYLPQESEYLTRKDNRVRALRHLLRGIVSRKDFLDFRQTLEHAATDCPNWDKYTLV